MKKIDISTKKYPNTYALVDDEDYERINCAGKWSAIKNTAGVMYAIRKPRKKGIKQASHMHRIVMNVLGDKEVDHINGNGLDNRKQNLRVCTRRMNAKNRKISRNNTSGYKGVCWEPVRRKWLAKITVDRKPIHLGLHETKEDAATAYDMGALKYHGEFARLNNVDFTKQESPEIDAYSYSLIKDCSKRWTDEDAELAVGLLSELSERERHVLILRFGLMGRKQHKLREIGDIYGLTREMIRVIQRNALLKLREYLDPEISCQSA